MRLEFYRVYDLGVRSLSQGIGMCGGFFAYTASKFGVRGLTQSVGERANLPAAVHYATLTLQTPALDLAEHKITVNAYAPGVINTDLCAMPTKHDTHYMRIDSEHGPSSCQCLGGRYEARVEGFARSPAHYLRICIFRADFDNTGRRSAPEPAYRRP